MFGMHMVTTTSMAGTHSARPCRGLKTATLSFGVHTQQWGGCAARRDMCLPQSLLFQKTRFQYRQVHFEGARKHVPFVQFAHTLVSAGRDDVDTNDVHAAPCSFTPFA